MEKWVEQREEPRPLQDQQEGSALLTVHLRSMCAPLQCARSYALKNSFSEEKIIVKSIGFLRKKNIHIISLGT